MAFRLLPLLFFLPSWLVAVTLPEVLEDMLYHYPGVMADAKEALIYYEQIDEAWSGARPYAEADADYGFAKQKLTGNPQAFLHPRAASVIVSQPLYRGGQTIADIRRAKSTYASQYALYHFKLQNLIFDTATAYLDVLRDKRIYASRINNHTVLQEQLNSVEARFETGELTITDVAQTKSRLAQAIAEEVRAKGDLDSSLQNLARYTTLPLHFMAPTNEQVPVPLSMQQLQQNVLAYNFEIIARKWEVIAAKANIALISGQNMPHLSLDAEWFKQVEQSTFSPDVRERSLSLNLNFPFYRGGRTYSQVQQAKAAFCRDLYRLREMERTLTWEAAVSWDNYVASLGQVVAFDEQVVAATIAFEGMVQQDLYGERTITDVLDAEQELFNAEVDLIRAERDRAVSELKMLLLTGDLTLEVFDEEC